MKVWSDQEVIGYIKSAYCYVFNKIDGFFNPPMKIRRSKTPVPCTLKKNRIINDGVEIVPFGMITTDYIDIIQSIVDKIVTKWKSVSPYIHNGDFQKYSNCLNKRKVYIHIKDLSSFSAMGLFRGETKVLEHENVIHDGGVKPTGHIFGICHGEPLVGLTMAYIPNTIERIPLPIKKFSIDISSDHLDQIDEIITHEFAHMIQYIITNGAIQDYNDHDYNFNRILDALNNKSGEFITEVPGFKTDTQPIHHISQENNELCISSEGYFPDGVKSYQEKERPAYKPYENTFVNENADLGQWEYVSDGKRLCFVNIITSQTVYRDDPMFHKLMNEMTTLDIPRHSI